MTFNPTIRTDISSSEHWALLAEAAAYHLARVNEVPDDQKAAVQEIADQAQAELDAFDKENS